MRKLFCFCCCFLLLNLCFAQNTTSDSLKRELASAKSDSAKLRIYKGLAEATYNNTRLTYVDTALHLIDKVLLNEHDPKERKKFFSQENGLFDLFGEYYRTNSSTDWEKAKSYLQNRLKAIENTGDQHRIAFFLYTLAETHLEYKSDSTQYRLYINRCIQVAKEIKDSSLLVDAYGYKAAVYWSVGYFAESMAAIQSALDISKNWKYSTGLTKSHRNLAFFYLDMGEDELALNNFQTALDMAIKAKDTLRICLSLNGLGYFYNKKKDVNRALEYFEKVLKISGVSANSGITSAAALLNIAWVYIENNEYHKALTYLEESLKKSVEDEKEFVFSEIGNTYNKLKQFEKAISYHSRAIQLADSVHDKYRTRSYLNYLLASDYFGLKNYTKAKELNSNAMLQYSKDWLDQGGRMEILSLAMQIDSALGNGLDALAHYKEYVSLKDKKNVDALRKETQKNIFLAEIEKQRSEQEKKDAITVRTRNLQYIAIGAILLLGIFLLYGYIQKNKANKQIEKAYTDLKSTQSQLIQSEKMASLGELTAGIAHEIQNPLNFVNNFSEVNKELADELTQEIDKGNYSEAKIIAKDIKDNEEKINHHGKRADSIVKGMLQHSRSSSGQKEPTDINALCDEYLRLAYHGLRAKDKSFNAKFETDLDESIGKIDVMPQDLGRVILNLINNAFYAVTERKKKGETGYEPVVIVSSKKENNNILIRVRDNGTGIPEHVLNKIFQPFFTTKPTGQGTGLGLSLSYDIITKGHNGELKVETREGEGTQFIIILNI